MEIIKFPFNTGEFFKKCVKHKNHKNPTASDLILTKGCSLRLGWIFRIHENKKLLIFSTRMR